MMCVLGGIFLAENRPYWPWAGCEVPDIGRMITKEDRCETGVTVTVAEGRISRRMIGGTDE